MAKQIVYVDDANIGATGDAAIVYDSGANTLTTTNAISATALTLSSTLTGGSSTDIALNTNKFTVDAGNGNTLIAGTLTQTGAVAAGGTITLGANADLIGSSTTEIDINNNFLVFGATGNTVIKGTLGLEGAFTGDINADIVINGDAFVLNAGTKVVSFGGAMTLEGTTAQTGALTCASTLSVAGVVTHGVAVAQPVDIIAAGNGAKTISVAHKLTTYVTNSVADIDASLADGETGQELIVILKTYDTNNVVITPTNKVNFATVTLNASGERAHFIFDGTNWHIVSTTGTVA